MEAASLLGKWEGMQGIQDVQHLMHLHKSQQVENKGIPTHPYWWSLTSWAVHMTGTAPQNTDQDWNMYRMIEDQAIFAIPTIHAPCTVGFQLLPPTYPPDFVSWTHRPQKLWPRKKSVQWCLYCDPVSIHTKMHTSSHFCPLFRTGSPDDCRRLRQVVTMDSRRLLYWKKALKQQHQQMGRLDGPGSSSGTCRVLALMGCRIFLQLAPNLISPALWDVYCVVHKYFPGMVENINESQYSRHFASNAMKLITEAFLFPLITFPISIFYISLPIFVQRRKGDYLAI